MTRDGLDFLKKWFSEYCSSFYSSNEEDRKNISLKEQHTYNVCKNIVLIAVEQSLTQNEIMLAETAALFHDVGRFSQYAKYKTFNDSISLNHGKLGAGILEKERLLKSLPEDEQELIIHTVKFHNAFSLPTLENQGMILFLKLIRDADKLDIWRVFTEYYGGSEAERASATTLELPDIPGYSEEVLSFLYKKQIVPNALLKTLNDFKLLQLSWVYDLNFRTSFRLLLEQDFIKRISAKLPQTEKIKKASLLLQEYANKKLE